MKKCFWIVALLVSNFAVAAQPDLGKEIPLRVTSYGKISFDAMYTLAGMDPDGLHYVVSFSSTWNGSDILQLPAALQWNIYLPSQGTYAGEWSDTRAMPRLALQFGQFSIADQSMIKSLLLNQKDAVIVFAGDVNHTPVAQLPLGKLCLSNPELFKDLSGHERKCSELTEADVNP